jgi:hypothetical protein
MPCGLLSSALSTLAYRVRLKLLYNLREILDYNFNRSYDYLRGGIKGR